MSSNQVTDAEFEAIIKEIAARCRDLVYMNSNKSVRRALEGIRDGLLTTESGMSISINYVVDFCYGDAQQIVGRLRGEEVKKQ